jgi:hypothetical protein
MFYTSRSVDPTGRSSSNKILLRFQKLAYKSLYYLAARFSDCAKIAMTLKEITNPGKLRETLGRLKWTSAY